MHTQRKHARQVEAAGAFFIFTIGENQPLLFEAAGALPWESVAGEAWTVDRGHGRVDVRTIKTLPPTGRIAALFPHARQVFLVERYSYGTDGTLLGAVAVLGITSLPPDQAGPLTCSLTCAATGPSRCTITSATSASGRTPAASAARTGPWPPSATPSPASSTCTGCRTSPLSSAPATATLTSSRCGSLAS